VTLALWVTAFVILLSIGLLLILVALMVLGSAVPPEEGEGTGRRDAPVRRSLIRILLRQPADLLIEKRRDDSI
jgi:hypothetical protein